MQQIGFCAMVLCCGTEAGVEDRCQFDVHPIQVKDVQWHRGLGFLDMGWLFGHAVQRFEHECWLWNRHNIPQCQRP